LPEKTAPTTETVAASSPPTAEQNANRKPASKEGGEDAQKAETPSESGGDAKAGDASASTSKKPDERAPISGGMLNGKAISLPQPEYPALAEQQKASGTVLVQVLVDETGSVIRARATTGHPLLLSAAEAAARQAKFAPTNLMGEPVKVTGILSYNFVAR